jgi:microcystin-dependent protein
MAEPFQSEISIFSGNFAPRGWAFCHNQLLSVAQYSSLFSLISTQYGGDGQRTFALPDLRGRTPIGEGQAAGLSNYSIGEKGGAELVTLTLSEIPSHSHDITVTTGTNSSPNSKDPNGNYLSDNQSGPFFSASGGATPLFDTADSGEAGANYWHNNMQPFLVVNYIIATAGIYPSRQ